MAQVMTSLKSLYSLLFQYDWPSDKTKKESEIKAATKWPTLDLERLAAPRDLPHIAPVGYAYDPAPNIPHYLRPSQLSFPQLAGKPNDCIQNNTIRLLPQEAGFPYRSSFNLVRQSKFWKANLDETIKVLELIAQDNTTADVEVGNGITLARLAKKELRPGIEHRMVVATSHMFCSADERRIRMIATLMIMYFVFDDKIEEAPEGSALSDLREDFFYLFENPGSRKASSYPAKTTSKLQHHIDSVIRGIGEEDAAGGNGGKEMLEAIRGAFRCVHPEKVFQTVKQYLEFRRLNVGARFVIAAAKFTIKSSVDSSDPRFARYLGLIGDHLGLINDLASYEKESKAFDAGEALDMINIVAVFQSLMSLPSREAATAAAYAYQLQVEAWIIEELDNLAKTEKLTDEEWWFLEAVFLSASGNTFFCMTSSRYGGEAAKV